MRRQRLRYVDTQCYDRKPEPKTDAGRIFERIAEVIESVAVVEERGDAEVVGQVADDFHGTGNEVFTAVLYRSDLVRALAGAWAGARALGSLADRLDRRKLVESETPHAVIAASEETA